MAPPKKALGEFAKVLGSTPPKEFGALSAADLATLTRLLAESIDLHEASLAAAEDDVIKLAPRPLRSTVRKLLGA